MSRIAIFCLLLATATTAVAQPQPPAPAPSAATPKVVSPEVGPDNRITFRLKAPNANEVLLALEGTNPAPMQKNDQGVWSTTVGPLDPDFYGYAFIEDGVTLTDPSNWMRKPNFLYQTSSVHVPGPPSLPWEENDTPHGEVHHHFYKSALIGDARDYYVYTPPGYDPRSKTKYPVLYLLHGFSDDASAWTAVGRANVILDNLISQGKARPMLVVMPLGYGAPEILSRGAGGYDGYDSLRAKNLDNFRGALLTEIIPRVEREYRADSKRGSRAIAGLSMGGQESLLAGLNTLDKFAWIGSFSAGGKVPDYDSRLASLNASANSQIRLLWIACGTDDGLIGLNRGVRELLRSKGIQHTDIETPGAHTWMVWRRNLAVFAPLLFR